VTGWLFAGYGAGLCFELVGVYYMAHPYLRDIDPGSFPSLMLSALFKGAEWKGARLASRPSDEGSEESNGKALRGLAFISLGFVLQAVTSGFQLYLQGRPN
jgi:hypothetical protein